MRMESGKTQTFGFGRTIESDASILFRVEFYGKHSLWAKGDRGEEAWNVDDMWI